MNLNLKIKNLSLEQLETMDFKCLDCDYWFNYDESGFFKELFEVKSLREMGGFIRGKLFEKKGIRIKKDREKRSKIIAFKMHGGKIKAAFVDKKCAGMILAGKYYLFPRLRSFNVFPPDSESIFLGCIYVIPEYRGMNIGKRLLIELEKELINEKVGSIESIGKRLDDSVCEESYLNSPLIPFKFLINNGFYLKKNDPLYPLLRLELKNIVYTYEPSGLAEKIILKKEARSTIDCRR
jgi:ribosomal protein S18 acetylase RimI-like enzyme